MKTDAVDGVKRHVFFCFLQVREAAPQCVRCLNFFWCLDVDAEKMCHIFFRIDVKAPKKI